MQNSAKIRHRESTNAEQEQPNAKPTDKQKRFRRTFGINRIPDLKERRSYANRKIKLINKQLKLGNPYVDPKERQPKGNQLTDTNILDALALAEKIKCNTDRERTIGMVESMCRIFTEFLELKGWTKMRINKFTRKHAVAFLDYGLFDRKIGARTYNNYIERMKAILNELVDREYLEVKLRKPLKNMEVLFQI